MATLPSSCIYYSSCGMVFSFFSLNFHYPVLGGLERFVRAHDHSWVVTDAVMIGVSSLRTQCTLVSRDSSWGMSPCNTRPLQADSFCWPWPWLMRQWHLTLQNFTFELVLFYEEVATAIPCRNSQVPKEILAVEIVSKWGRENEQSVVRCWRRPGNDVSPKQLTFLEMWGEMNNQWQVLTQRTDSSGSCPGKDNSPARQWSHISASQPHTTNALFGLQNFLALTTVALSFVCDNYYPIIE